MAQGQQVATEIAGKGGQQESDATGADHQRHHNIGQTTGAENRLFKQIGRHGSLKEATIVTRARHD